MMNRRNQGIALAVMGAVAFQASAFATSSPKAKNLKAKQQSREAEFVAGDVIVKLNGQKGLQAARAQLLSTLESKAGLKVKSARSFQTDETLTKIVLADASETDRAIAALQADPSVQYAERNVIYRRLDAGVPNDADFSKLWGLQNVGQADSAGQVGTPGADIDVVKVWQTGKTGSKNILVAVIDTGVSLTHADLKDNLYTNPGEIAGNEVDDDGNGFVDDVHGWNFFNNTSNANDDNDHGTHCAGTIGGTGNNGQGVAGVNWTVSLLPVKFLSGSGSGTLEAAVESINYAAKMGAQIMSNSWGCASQTCNTQALGDAIKAAGEKGILFVAAAGNDGQNNDSAPNFPSNYPYPNVLAVAATDNRDVLAAFSNYGKNKVHVAAPGVKIYSTVKSGGYDSFSGTSMATPHVAGIAALMMSVDSSLDYAEVKRRLILTSTPVAGLKKKVTAQGRVNAYNAVMNIETPREVPPAEGDWQDVTFSAESEHPYLKNQDLTWTATVPNAKFVRVFFEQVDVEDKFDVVRVESATGEVVDEITGKVDNYKSEYVQGETAVIRLKSDFSVERWGFKATKVQAVY